MIPVSKNFILYCTIDSTQFARGFYGTVIPIQCKVIQCHRFITMHFSCTRYSVDRKYIWLMLCHSIATADVKQKQHVAHSSLPFSFWQRFCCVAVKHRLLASPFDHPHCGACASLNDRNCCLWFFKGTHCSVTFSALFCGWSPVTCKDLAQMSSAPTCCAIPVKPTLLGWLSSPIIHRRTVCF